MKRYPIEVVLSNQEYLALVNQRDSARHVLARIDSIVGSKLETARKLQAIHAMASDIEEVLSDCGFNTINGNGKE